MTNVTRTYNETRFTRFNVCEIDARIVVMIQCQYARTSFCMNYDDDLNITMFNIRNYLYCNTHAHDVDVTCDDIELIISNIIEEENQS
jgi:hypothetical protein